MKAIPADGGCVRVSTAPRVGVRADTTARRTVDVLTAAVSLVLLTPLLGLVALAVLLDSGRPVFYRQERVGRAGRAVRIIKFRTMTVGADRSGPLVSARSDPRVTRVGGFLRTSKLDELPQLVNVLRGDLTLIGPRAEVARYVAAYTDDELATLAVRPGLTGPGALLFISQSAQLDDAEDAEAQYVGTHLHEKLAADLEYLRHRSVRRDLRIVARTLAALC
jgi:lipopolysaccharide/colanic/teichoic acid biosynthesis glycosyltransferase